MLVIAVAVRAKAFSLLQVIESSHVFEQTNTCVLVANRHAFRCEVRQRQMCVCASHALTLGNKAWVVLWPEIIFKLTPDSVIVDIAISDLRPPSVASLPLSFLMFISHGVEMYCCKE